MNGKPLPKVAIHPDTKKAIKLIATIRNQTITEVAEEFLAKAGLQTECKEIIAKSGWGGNGQRAKGPNGQTHKGPNGQTDDL